MGILAQQIIALAIVLIEKLFFSLFPILSKTFKGNQLLMGVTNAFAGGVFLSAGLTHILPHAQMYFEEQVTNYGFNHDTDFSQHHDHIDEIQNLKHEEEKFPWVNVIAGMSFTLVFVINKVLFTTHSMLHSADLLETSVQKIQEKSNNVDQDSKELYQVNDLEQELNPKVKSFMLP